MKRNNQLESVQELTPAEMAAVTGGSARIDNQASGPRIEVDGNCTIVYSADLYTGNMTPAFIECSPSSGFTV